MNGVVKMEDRYYVTVHRRLSEFRSSHPDYSIETECLPCAAPGAFFKAIIKDKDGRVIATGHRFVAEGPIDCVGTAETQAVGRALALAGFGSEDLLPEMIDKVSDLADSPVGIVVKSDGKSTESEELAQRLAQASVPSFRAQLTKR